MRRRAAIWLLPLWLGVLPACSSASSPAAGTGLTGTVPTPAHPTAVVHVSPGVGNPHTAFLVTFKAPAAAGAARIRATTYEISAQGPQGSGCQPIALGKPIRTARKGEHERVRLRPPADGWCRGAYRGTVELISGPNCTKGTVCPEFASIVATVGRFTFRVQ